MVDVVAALITSGDRFLICRRPEGKKRGLLWEFPGGKLENGETPEQALIRECREELNVTVDPHGIFSSVVYSYPDITVRLTVYNTELVSGTPELLWHSDLKWISSDEIDEYDFCPADVDILEKIRNSLL